MLGVGSIDGWMAAVEMVLCARVGGDVVVAFVVWGCSCVEWLERLLCVGVVGRDDESPVN